MVSRRRIKGTAWLGLLAALAGGLAGPGRAAPAPADTLAALEQFYRLADDGSAVLILTIVPAAPGPGELALPFGETTASDFVIEGDRASFTADAAGPAPVRQSAGRALLVLDIPAGVAAGDTIRVRCRVARAIDWAKARQAFGASDVSRTFVNDAGLSIGHFRMEIQLPESYRFRRITGSEPAFKPQASPDPPYAIGRRDGRDTASLTTNHFRPGARARLGLEAERVHRSAVPLFGGVLLGILYLVFFRNSVAGTRQQGAGPTQQENPS